MTRTVVLVDDDQAVLESLEAVFDASGYQVHAFLSADAFLSRLEALPVSCVVTDLRMPGTDGLSLVRALASRDQAWPCIVLSGHAEVSDVVAVMQAGALDFLVKPFPPRKLVAAVEAATVAQAAPASRTATRAKTLEASYRALTPREREVAEHLVSGSSSRVCGESLGISPRTVDVFRGRIFRKMGVSNIAGLATAIATLGSRTRADP